MGLFNKLKFKKTVAPEKEVKEEKKKVPVKAPAAKEKTETVLAPDGRLVNVPKKSESKQKKVKIRNEETGDAYRVLMRPLITEKGSALGMNNQYVFAVSLPSNKIEIKKAIKKVYGVEPLKVNIINISGKKIRYGRTEGWTKKWKKAVITLAPGQKIEIQEGL